MIVGAKASSSSARTKFMGEGYYMGEELARSVQRTGRGILFLWRGGEPSKFPAFLSPLHDPKMCVCEGDLHPEN